MSYSFQPTCDLADIFKQDTLSIDTQFRQFGQNTTAVGKVRTISCFQDNLLVKKTLNSPGNGDILVVDGRASTHTALVGDLIAGAAVKNGWAGIIVNSVIRDSDELAKLPIHIKALGTNPRKSTQIEGNGELDVPLTINDIEIKPGDLLFSDNDGIIIVKDEHKSKLSS